MRCTEHLHNESSRSSDNSLKFTCMCLPGNKPLLVRSSSTKVLKIPSVDCYFTRNPWWKKQEFLLSSTYLPVTFINFSMQMEITLTQVSSDRFLSFLLELVRVYRNTHAHTRTHAHTHTLLGKTSAWHDC